MATYKDIKRQIADLEKKAAEARKVEVAKVITAIKSQIAEYDLTPADLFKGSIPIGVKRAKAATNTVKSANPPKYMDPKTGKTWTGHGKPPAWIAAASKKGKKDDFLIANVQELRSAKATKPAVAGAAKVVKPKNTVKRAVTQPLAKKSPAAAKQAVTANKRAAKAKVPTAKKNGSPEKPAVVEATSPTPTAESSNAPVASATT